MPDIKKNCHWYDEKSMRKCGVLTELVCHNKKRCSFFETEEAFEKRQGEFLESHTGEITKMCSGCKEVKPISEFGRKSRSADGIDHYCRECNRKRVNARLKERK